MAGISWGWFTGADKAKKQAMATASENKGYINSGLDKQLGWYGDARDAGRGYMQPYADSGRQGQEAYTNILGLNGADNRANALAAYQGNNPYLSGDMDAATQAIARRAAAQGQGGYNGLTALAQQRATRDMGSQDYNNYLGRLQGLGQQGQQAATGMMGNEWQYANSAGNAQAGATQGLVGNNTQLGNALSSANVSPMSYMMQNAQMALSAMSGKPSMGSSGAPRPSAGANNFSSYSAGPSAGYGYYM